MWNKIQATDPVSARMRRQEYKRHVRSLLNVRCLTDTSCPQRPACLREKIKTKVREAQREAQIMNANAHLVDRLLHMKQSFLGDVRFKSSLNHPLKQKKQFKIRQDNQKLVKKLITISSSYDCSKTLKQTAKMQQLSRSISRHKNTLDVSDDYRHLRSTMQSRRDLKSSMTRRSLALHRNQEA